MDYPQFIGCWQLLEWKSISLKGEDFFPLGMNLKGIINYSSEGLVMVQIMKEGRPCFSTDHPFKGEAAEVISAYNTFSSYAGTYEIKEPLSEVIHHITISSFPNWAGIDQVRKYEFKDDRLILKTHFNEDEYQLIWQKVKVL